MAFNHKHLIDITEYSEEDIKLILETAKAFSEVNERAIKKVPTLKGKTIVNMFNEPSTRTRSSFELAEKRLSADSLNFGGSSTSTVKGESLVDTVETLNAYKIDCIVVRDKHAGCSLHRHAELARERHLRRRRQAQPSHAGPSRPVHHLGAQGSTSTV